MYNLAPLGRTDGNASFTAGHSEGWYFSYNPCWSFSLGDCRGGDVAMCRWTQTSHENIGKQSTFKCGFDENSTPQLEYHNRHFQGLTVIINLKCDPEKKSIHSAQFAVKYDLSSPMKFLVTHNCACPDGCPVDPTTTEPSKTSTYPTTEPSSYPTSETSVTPAPRGGHDWKDIGVPVLVAGGGVGLVILAVVVIWRLINRDNQRDQRQRPRHNGYGGVDQTISDFSEPNEGGSSGNVAQPMSVSSSSDNVTFNKAFNTETGSVPV